MNQMDLLKKVIAHYKQAYLNYQHSNDFKDLCYMDVDLGVCNCLEEYFEIKILPKWVDEYPHGYWYETPEEYETTEFNLNCLQYRIDKLNDIFLHIKEEEPDSEHETFNPNQLVLLLLLILVTSCSPGRWIPGNKPHVDTRAHYHGKPNLVQMKDGSWRCCKP